MYVLLWEFVVKAGAESAFEALYGPRGGWAELFRTSSHYEGTELLRAAAADDSRRYVTIDRWHSREAYEVFRRERVTQYAALDREGEALTDEERALGDFTTRE